MIRTAVLGTGLCAMVLGGGTAIAQQAYPSKPITLQVFTSAGSPVDVYARVLARLITPDLGRNVIVDNRPGGSGVPMINAMVQAPADGYLIAATTVTLATLFGEQTAKFAPRDLQMIARSQIDPFAIVVHTSTPFRNLRELIGFARAKPGFVNLGGPLTMSSHRVAFELLAEKAGLRATWVSYTGGGQVLTAIAGGQVDAAHTNPGNAKPLVAAGKIRLLAVSSERRVEGFEDVPTYRESGIDLVRYNWRGIVARSGMPADVMSKLSGAIEKAHRSEAWKTYLRDTAQIDGYLDPKAANDLLAEEIADATRVKKRLGL